MDFIYLNKFIYLNTFVIPLTQKCLVLLYLYALSLHVLIIEVHTNWQIWYMYITINTKFFSDALWSLPLTSLPIEKPIILVFSTPQCIKISIIQSNRSVEPFCNGRLTLSNNIFILVGELEFLISTCWYTLIIFVFSKCGKRQSRSGMLQSCSQYFLSTSRQTLA